jgi:hypothetical protein
MVIFQLDVVHNWHCKLPQNSMDEKLLAKEIHCHSYATKWHRQRLGVKRMKWPTKWKL